MSNLSMVEAELPPGFRFHPRDVELICDYLMKKVTCSDQCPLMVEVDLNKCEPWDIPETACVGGKERYFYSQRDRKYATGLRTNRATVSGYWKATGKDRAITGRGGTLVGMRKTLVFYHGRAPKGIKTEWVMHEFRLEGPLGPPKISSPKEDWVLCRVFYKSRSEVPGKQGMGRGYDEARSSSSLPPLMDSYVTFDITNNEYEQVPCFSLFTPNQMINPNITPINNHMEPSISSAKSSSSTSNNTFGGIPDVGACLYPLSCDQKVLEEVLSHLTSPPNIRGLPSLGNEGSSEGFLSDVGVPSMLSHYYCS